MFLIAQVIVRYVTSLEIEMDYIKLEYILKVAYQYYEQSLSESTQRY
jgi:hypothetical protein